MTYKRAARDFAPRIGRKQKTDIGKYSFVNRTISSGTNCLQMF
jgi:hypothetical protein